MKTEIYALLSALCFGLALVFTPFTTIQAQITVCPVGCDYDNIQDAVNAADPGDVIEVAEGTYIENVTIPNSAHNLVLNGAKAGVAAGPMSNPENRGTDETIIEGTIQWQTGTGPTGVIIDGFTIVNSNSRAIIIRDSDAIIRNNILEGVERQSPANTNHNGILTASGQGNTTIEYNAIVNFERGLALDGNPGDEASLMRGNYFSGNSSAIFTFGSYSSGNQITNNLIENNSFGVTALNGQHYLDNTFSSNGNYGIRYQFGSGHLDEVTIIGNSFIENGTGIGFYDDHNSADQVLVNGNLFENNSGLALRNDFSFITIDATCNFWSTESHSDISDIISGDIDFIPFLAEDANGSGYKWSNSDTYSCTGVGPVIVFDPDGSRRFFANLQDGLDGMFPFIDGSPHSGSLLEFTDEDTGEVNYYKKAENDDVYIFTLLEGSDGVSGQSGLWTKTMF